MLDGNRDPMVDFLFSSIWPVDGREFSLLIRVFMVSGGDDDCFEERSAQLLDCGVCL